MKALLGITLCLIIGINSNEDLEVFKRKMKNDKTIKFIMSK